MDMRMDLGAAVLLCLLLGLALAASPSGMAAGKPLPRLRVSENGRFLVTEDGKPFFWLGDTAWWMTSLKPEEVDAYLAHRARHRFTVIQFHCGRLVADYAGRMPFKDNDAGTPVEDYWRSVDAIVEKAGQRGLYVALVPLWGEEYGRLFGTDAEKARRFGRWIGARYAGYPHVLWIVSGEHDSINNFRLPITPAQKAVLSAAAEGLREATGGRQLMTVHPGAARTSSTDFHALPWLDLNMLQSGHVIDAGEHGMEENHALITHDYALRPVKPVLDGEPIYEDTPDGIWVRRDESRPRAGADAMRRKAYWAVFAGACGHTYGHNDVYGFFVPSSPGYVQKLPQGPGNRGYWKTSLDAPGALQMKHLRRLMESRPFLTLAPDLSLLASGPGSRSERLGALRGRNCALVYTPTGRSFHVRLDRLGAGRWRAGWFDPRTGKSIPAGPVTPVGEREFAPPGEPGLGNDRVLTLDRAAAR